MIILEESAGDTHPAVIKDYEFAKNEDLGMIHQVQSFETGFTIAKPQTGEARNQPELNHGFEEVSQMISSVSEEEGH